MSRVDGHVMSISRGDSSKSRAGLSKVNHNSFCVADM